MAFAIGRSSLPDQRSSVSPPMAAKDKKVDHLLPTAVLVQAPCPRRSKWRTLGLIALLASAFSVASQYVDPHSGPFSFAIPSSQFKVADTCPQSNSLYPEQHAQLWESLGHDFDEDAFTTRAVDWLAGAVRIPTETYDDMGPVGEDEEWEKFGPLHDYLAEAFPLTHLILTLTKVNTYGLFYEWKGSDDSLKPLLLAAHQDVVPVEPLTADQWTYPPFSGHYDGDTIWGRGTADNKNGLIGALASIETLLENGFQPARTIILASGFDEEIGGDQGAKYLNEAIIQKYGKDSIALLIDEGGVFANIEGSIIAIPGTAEKGALNTRVTVTTPGGHSSLPPSHTGIGILSRLLVKYENNPIEPQLERDTPVYSMVQCVGQHSKDLSEFLRTLIEQSLTSDKALRLLEELLITQPVLKALIGTTQAITLVQGGVKVNSLPEEAWAGMNQRIATQSSVAAVKERNTQALEHLAEDFNLTYTAFGSLISPEGGPSSGVLTLTEAWSPPLEPAPETPTDEDSAPWQLFGGTVKATYNAQRGLHGDNNIFVSPGVPTANMDSKHYWNLTRHIFRYSHIDAVNLAGAPNNIHTVNEYIKADNFVEIIRFYTTLILNADESREI